MDYFDFHISQFEPFSIGSNMCFKTGFGSRTENDGGTGFLSQVEVSAHKICMKMGFQHVFDAGSLTFCPFNIWLHLTQRIYNGYFPIAFNVIGSMRQASGVNLFGLHNWFYLRV